MYSLYVHTVYVHIAHTCILSEYRYSTCTVPSPIILMYARQIQVCTYYKLMYRYMHCTQYKSLRYAVERNCWYLRTCTVLVFLFIDLYSVLVYVYRYVQYSYGTSRVPVQVCKLVSCRLSLLYRYKVDLQYLYL